MFNCYPGQCGITAAGQSNSASASDAGCGTRKSSGNTVESSKPGILQLRNNCHIYLCQALLKGHRTMYNLGSTYLSAVLFSLYYPDWLYRVHR